MRLPACSGRHVVGYVVPLYDTFHHENVKEKLSSFVVLFTVMLFCGPTRQCTPGSAKVIYIGQGVSAARGALGNLSDGAAVVRPRRLIPCQENYPSNGTQHQEDKNEHNVTPSAPIVLLCRVAPAEAAMRT